MEKFAMRIDGTGNLLIFPLCSANFSHFGGVACRK
jgi:hypothetical protein